MCAVPGKMCVSEMHHIDASRGGGRESHANMERLQYDKRLLERGHEAPDATSPASGRPPRGGENPDVQPEGAKPREASPAVNQPATTPDPTQGHTMPGAPHTPAPAQLNNRSDSETTGSEKTGGEKTGGEKTDSGQPR